MTFPAFPAWLEQHGHTLTPVRHAQLWEQWNREAIRRGYREIPDTPRGHTWTEARRHRWTEAEAIEAVRKYMERHGKAPVARDIGGNQAMLPTTRVARRLFGGWKPMLRAAANTTTPAT